MSELLLPLGYLSHSAKTLWKSDKQSYRNKYYYRNNVSSLSSPEIDFGKNIAEQLETMNITNPMLKYFIDSGQLPVYPVREHELRVTIEGVPLLGKLDMFHPATLTFRDDKTGHKEWTQKIVDKHPQLPFYSLLIKEKYGSVNEQCYLDWMQTEMVNETNTIIINGTEYTSTIQVPQFTGHIELFERTITDMDRFRELQDIVQCAHEISADYKRFLENQ